MAPPVDIGTIASTDRASGFYAHLDKDLVGLFVINGRLYICLNNIVHEVSPKTTAEYSRNGDQREICLNLDQDKIVIAYTNSREPVSTVFYSEEEEDVDFGLWLSNVLNSSERKQIAVDVWSE
jgi:hypothetical protein